MRNLFYIILIIILSYLILVFASPSAADNIGEKIGLKDINSQIRDFKTKLDFFSLDDKKGNIIDKVSEIGSGVIQARTIITDKITETKTDLDTTRQAVNKTNENIQKTKESIDNTLNSVQEVQDSLKNVVQ
ncbi:MAG: hypothetical protein PHR68_01110 [Candidatus Gracilibacteria bacterium]|nr:hypothetical protein [Candidatus Gracilibacteria bacterium]